MTRKRVLSLSVSCTSACGTAPALVNDYTLSWVERVPTYKDQIQQLGEQGKDINTYGFLGYPILMAADILAYRADTVPVGDQLPT